MARRLQDPDDYSRRVRNLHIYDAGGTVIGGVYQNGSISCNNFYDMCPMFLEFQPNNAAWAIFHLNLDGSTGQPLVRSAQPIPAGLYAVLDPNGGPVNVSPIPGSYPRRILTNERSSKLTTRRLHFRNAVRARDQACMLSGTPVINDLFVGFTASHIFPHAREGEWLRRNFHSIVTDSAPARQIGFTKIHSPQNGILIFGGNHALFDEFLVSVNPDDGYKITYFAQDNVGLDGRILGFACRDPQNPLRVRDEFLRWHFHTAVLAHMRAAAERPWEMDFPDGDMMGEIMSQSDAAERMEVELFTRLGISM